MKVDIRGLTKRYDKVIAVDNLNLDIKDGEFVSILGPSGCGKSTFLYMLTGITEPTDGEIFFNDKKINNVHIENRNIGLVFQDYSLYPHLTVKDNLMFPLKMNKVDKKTALEKVEDISRILKIEDLLSRKPKELSGGQQQRVAIGRAIIKSPNLLLMDEPFSNLDASLRIEMREEIKNIQDKFKITTLFVTHDQEEALSISDRVILMNKGKIIQYSTPRELYKYPNSIYSASFIGRPKINIILRDKLNSLGLDYKEFQEEDKYIAIGIRPEDIFLGKNQNTLNAKIIKGMGEEKVIETEYRLNSIKGIIKSLLLLGKDTYITVGVDEQELRVVITGNYDFIVGQAVYINFNRIYMFKE